MRRLALDPANDPSVVARNEYRQFIADTKRLKHWDRDNNKNLDILGEVEVGYWGWVLGEMEGDRDHGRPEKWSTSFSGHDSLYNQ